MFLLCACATPSQPHEGYPVLAAIQFEGNRSIARGELLSKIATSPSSGFFTKTPRYYDADLFAVDLKRIVRWYNEKGFYEAAIAGVDEERDSDGRVTVRVRIEEGRRAIVRKMDLEGLDAIPKDETSAIEDALPLHPGDAFDEDLYEKTLAALEDQLKQHGFARAQATGKVEVKPLEGEAHLTFVCVPGERFHFGKVVVTGNRLIPADPILFATGLHKGDLYSPRAIALAQQRVYNLGTFSGVRVGLEPLGDVPVAAVRVSVREAPFQTVRFGVGGSVEETRWELPRLHAEYTNRSLFGGLRRLELSSTTGYAFVSSPLQYDVAHSGITTHNSAQLTVPNILFPGLDWVSRGEFAREVQSGFAYDDVAARTGFLYRNGRHSVGPALNFIHYFLVDLYNSQLSDVISKGGSGAGIVHDCPSHCSLTYPEIRYTYDGRDDAIEPTLGFYFTTSLQQTLKPGTFSYFRVNPELRVYLPVAKLAVVALRAEYGGLFTETADGASPFTQRFFYGGQNEQRGYPPLGQGPKLGASPVCDVTGASTTTPACGPGQIPYATVGVPIGAKYAALFSAELRLHADFILNHLGIVGFVDASAVQNDQQVLSGGLEFAPGVGLRYVTAFGPVRIDVAWLANPKIVDTDPVIAADGKTVLVAPTPISPYCSKIDQRCIHEARWAFHLTLGEAF